MSLIADIKKHEGYSKTVYKDHLGKDTIGYGFLIQALELDEDICDDILDRILARNESTIRRHIEWYDDKPPKVKNIIQEMFYQLHYKLFQFRKTLRYIENDDYKAASIEMLDSLWAKQCANRAKETSEKMAKVDENL